MAIIYHLTSQDAWQAAQPSGEYEAPSLAEEGFIHCSKDESQLLRVAERLYQGRGGPAGSRPGRGETGGAGRV